jgi:hypothetical protein
MQITHTTIVYTSVTRSRYSNVVNANQIGARNTELMYTREVLRYKVSFMPGQEWMFD